MKKTDSSSLKTLLSGKKEASSEFVGAVLVLIAGILWGSIGFFVAELHSLHLDAGMISFLRVGFACLLSLIVTIFKEGLSALKITGKDLINCALLGIVCHGIYNIFYSFAVTYSGVTVSAVLLNIAPPVTTFTAFFLFREKITGFKLIAILVNMIGCVLTVTGGNVSAATLSVIGILCGIGAGTCYAMTAIFGRLASGNRSPWVISTWSYFFAAVSLFPYAKPAAVISSIPAKAWIIAFLYALIPTTIAYFFYYAGVAKVKNSSIVPVLASSETVVAALFGLCFYKEQLNLISLAGIGLVLFSIGISRLRLAASEEPVTD